MQAPQEGPGLNRFSQEPRPTATPQTLISLQDRIMADQNVVVGDEEIADVTVERLLDGFITPKRVKAILFIADANPQGNPTLRYSFSLSGDGSWRTAGRFEVSWKPEEKQHDFAAVRFSPPAVNQHPSKWQVQFLDGKGGYTEVDAVTRHRLAPNMISRLQARNTLLSHTGFREGLGEELIGLLDGEIQPSIKVFVDRRENTQVRWREEQRKREERIKAATDNLLAHAQEILNP